MSQGQSVKMMESQATRDLVRLREEANQLMPQAQRTGKLSPELTAQAVDWFARALVLQDAGRLTESQLDVLKTFIARMSRWFADIV